MAFAERTEVALEKSISEIVQLLKRAGAQRISAPIADEYATGAPGLLMLKGPA